MHIHVMDLSGRQMWCTDSIRSSSLVNLSLRRIQTLNWSIFGDKQIWKQASWCILFFYNINRCKRNVSDFVWTRSNTDVKFESEIESLSFEWLINTLYLTFVWFVNFVILLFHKYRSWVLKNVVSNWQMVKMQLMLTNGWLTSSLKIYLKMFVPTLFLANE